ncbi:aminotransferase class I/II-fold pyridoxal phosphate-dependent enzyme [Aspergillus glaucus CBS 516.65]|uniref:Aminotransferase class I/classII large domain-containing protein n=1 Tax=Aspergillus glaucus CBS 516.65 TaxID=1160497 RepID=A0A1L9VD46_ASPGL|nr:hypothetical protein ASPGLDRAFT_49786 [Aspergillus glaucus CBS 516.65]OJJ81820.1 hypothetical protein ASPGLDRAFT_49786 [Aspergillus glaucus CBS 516.65]
MALHDAFRSALQKRQSKSSRRQLTLRAPNAIDFSSNDFLSLSTSPLFRERFLSLLNQAPPNYPFASGGSRLLDGNSSFTEGLEHFIANFHNAPTGLLFNSGFDANVGVLSSIPQPGDGILYDEHIHASAHEGMRLSRVGWRESFSHSCPVSLRQKLEERVRRDPGIASGERNVFVAFESVYSMDGDVAPIREIVRVVDELLPAGNAYFLVDEAHATGVLGPRGAGVVQELGLEERMLVRVHTFGKALASHGAIVLCSPDTRDYLINYARSLIYTTALGYPYLASIRAAYELLSEGHVEPHRQTLQHLIHHIRQLLLNLNPGHFQLDHSPSSPILSLRTLYPRQLADVCQKAGFVVRAIMAPTVPKGQERVRVCVHAGNTEEEIEGLVGVIKRWMGGKL